MSGADERPARATPADEQRNRLGRMIAGFGRQVAENWDVIVDDEVLHALTLDVSRLVDTLAFHGDHIAALDQLDEDSLRLPLVDADITAGNRGGAS